MADHMQHIGGLGIFVLTGLFGIIPLPKKNQTTINTKVSDFIQLSI
jgi:hypothetical protein